MSFLDLFRKKKAQIDNRLVGKWRLQASAQALEPAEETVSEFTADGRLTHSLTQDGKTGIMKLTYRTEGGVIFSDQPSHPAEEETAYHFDDDGALVLTYDGQESRFVRIE